MIQKFVNSSIVSTGGNTFQRWKNGVGVDRGNMETSDVCISENRCQKTMTHGPNLAFLLFFVNSVNWNTATHICLCIFCGQFNVITAELFSCDGKEYNIYYLTFYGKILLIPDLEGNP